MREFAIVSRTAWGDGARHASECEGAIIVTEADLDQAVMKLCGRNPLGYPSVRRRLREEGRIYLAKSGRGASGIIVEQMPASDLTTDETSGRL